MTALPSTEIKEEEFKVLLLSQGDEPGSYYSTREITLHLEISKSNYNVLLQL